MPTPELRCPYCHTIVPFCMDWLDPLRLQGRMACPQCWRLLWSVSKVLEHLGVNAA